MDKPSKIKIRILGKVYLIWFLRRIIPLMVIEIAALAFTLRIFAKNVFVSMALRNIGIAADRGYWGIIKYLISSFLQTHFIIQIVILIILGFGALLLRDILKSVFTYLNIKRKGS